MTFRRKKARTDRASWKFLVAWGAIECPLLAPSSLEFREASKRLLPRLLQAIFDRRTTPNHRPKNQTACSLAAVGAEGKDWRCPLAR